MCKCINYLIIGSTGNLPGREKKRTIWSICLLPTDMVSKKNIRDLLEQLPVSLMLLKGFKVHNPLWRSEKKTSTRGMVLEKILDKYNILCLNNKEKTHNRAYDGCKSTIDLIYQQFSRLYGAKNMILDIVIISRSS